MIQIGQAKNSSTIIRLDSVFAYGDGLPCRKMGTTPDGLGNATFRLPGRYRLRGFERYGLIATVIVEFGRNRA
jgi:hypothetical protein